MKQSSYERVSILYKLLNTGIRFFNLFIFIKCLNSVLVFVVLTKSTFIKNTTTK